MIPPMNDTLAIFVQRLDETTGEPLRDKYGRDLEPERRETVARVKKTAEMIFTRSGNQVNAKLKADIPPNTLVYPGMPIEWTDRHGLLIKGVIESVEEVLNYSGKKAYWQKVFIT